MLLLTRKSVGVIAAAALATGLAGAAPAATQSFGALPAASAGTPKEAATGDGPGFDTFVFSLKAPVFEYGNVGVAAVPVPAAGLLLLTAVGAAGVLRRRRSA
jgi:hypothetical protein